jgi:ribosomal protein S18 acetylase RimI-like enzyme
LGRNGRRAAAYKRFMGTNAVGSLRRAKRADLAELLDMMRVFNRAEHIPFRRARTAVALERLLREPRLGLVVVIEAAGRGTPALAGYAVVTLGYDLEFGGPDGFVTEIFVRPGHRRHGLGAQLLDAAMGALRAAGAGAVHLFVWPENRAARRLYARAGFVEVRRVAMSRSLGPRRPTARGAGAQLVAAPRGGAPTPVLGPVGKGKQTTDGGTASR